MFFSSCGETAFLKPFTVSAHTTLSSIWFQSMLVFGNNEFLNNSDLHCTVLKHLLLLVTCVIMRCVIKGLMRGFRNFVKGGRSRSV